MEDNFDAFLTWLDPDREKAGQKYEEIRHSLIAIFEWRGAYDPQDLADETINRVSSKFPEIVTEYKGDPALYFYGVAKRLAFEVSRRQQARVELENPEQLPAADVSDQPDEQEAIHECLDKCLAQLSTADKELILLYYQHGQPNISHRQDLARRYRLVPNALRQKVHRIRKTLHTCLNKCLGKAL